MLLDSPPSQAREGLLPLVPILVKDYIYKITGSISPKDVAFILKTLFNDDILEGKHILKDYGVNPKEKVFYTIFIKGIDRASNAGISDSLTSVTFDITPPEFSFSYPSNDLPVNTTKISFKLSEELEKGSITWIATKGDDPLSPHTKDLEGDQKKEGEKLDLSSTGLREKLEKNRMNNNDLPSEIFNYIKENNIY